MRDASRLLLDEFGARRPQPVAAGVIPLAICRAASSRPTVDRKSAIWRSRWWMRIRQKLR